MKLCQKCIAGLKFVADHEYGDIETMMICLEIEGVFETECEFWAHKELRRVSNKYEDQRERSHELGLSFPDDLIML